MFRRVLSSGVVGEGFGGKGVKCYTPFSVCSLVSGFFFYMEKTVERYTSIFCFIVYFFGVS